MENNVGQFTVCTVKISLEEFLLTEEERILLNQIRNYSKK